MAEPTVIQLEYEPRPFFVPFHARHQRLALLVCHRRAGKTVACINDLVSKALNTKKKNARYGYTAPYYGTAKKAAWQYLADAVRDIPGTQIHTSDISVTLYNGANIRIFGADKPDSLRGQYFDGIILDEVGDMRASIWPVISPALLDRNGWAVFIGTPKGKNFFWEQREKARRDNGDQWFYMDLKASESGVFTPEQLDIEKAKFDEETYAQEFENNFESSNRGSYWGKEIAEITENKQVTRVDHDPSFPVHVSFDLGFSDATVMWFYQIVGRRVNIINWVEHSGVSAEYYHDVLIELGKLNSYNYGEIWLPHDSRAHSFQTGITTVELFLKWGWKCRVVPRMKKGDSIKAARRMLKRCWFDEERCYAGIEHLKAYQKEWNSDLKVFIEAPKHDQHSHSADSFKYLCTAVATSENSGELEPERKAPIPTVEQMTLDRLWDTARKPVVSTRI